MIPNQRVREKGATDKEFIELFRLLTNGEKETIIEFMRKGAKSCVVQTGTGVSSNYQGEEETPTQ